MLLLLGEIVAKFNFSYILHKKADVIIFESDTSFGSTDLKIIFSGNKLYNLPVINAET
jgi:hypothetical protein